MHTGIEIEICKESSIISCYKQYARNSDIWIQTNVRHSRLKILRIPYHVREEDKRILDKEIKRLCYLGILKEGSSAYSSPVMLISRKATQDKRVVTAFRHLNTRIAKNNLAYPLVKDMFTMLGNSKCNILSVLDLKDAFHSLTLTENSKKYCGILPYFRSDHIYTKGCLWDLMLPHWFGKCI